MFAIEIFLVFDQIVYQQKLIDDLLAYQTNRQLFKVPIYTILVKYQSEEMGLFFLNFVLTL